MYKVNWDEYFQGIRELISQIKADYDCILAISRGGTIVGTILSHKFKLPMAVIISESYDNEHNQKTVRLSDIIKPPSLSMSCPTRYLIVDDLLDTGKTIDAIKDNSKNGDWMFGGSFDTAVLFHKGKCKEPTYWAKKIEDWIEFPYENFS